MSITWLFFAASLLAASFGLSVNLAGNLQTAQKIEASALLVSDGSSNLEFSPESIVLTLSPSFTLNDCIAQLANTVVPTNTLMECYVPNGDHTFDAPLLIPAHVSNQGFTIRGVSGGNSVLTAVYDAGRETEQTPAEGFLGAANIGILTNRAIVFIRNVHLNMEDPLITTGIMMFESHVGLKNVVANCTEKVLSVRGSSATLENVQLNGSYLFEVQSSSVVIVNVFGESSMVASTSYPVTFIDANIHLNELEITRIAGNGILYTSDSTITSGGPLTLTNLAPATADAQALTIHHSHISLQKLTLSEGRMSLLKMSQFDSWDCTITSTNQQFNIIVSDMSNASIYTKMTLNKAISSSLLVEKKSCVVFHSLGTFSFSNSPTALKANRMSLISFESTPIFNTITSETEASQGSNVFM